MENEGIVAEVLETESEEAVEEEVAEEEMADVADWEGMETRIQNLEDAVASLKEDKESSTEMADEEVVEEVAEEVATEVVETVESAVEEIAAAIDEATSEEVTPELAAQAAEIAVGIIQEKTEEAVEEVALSRKRKLSKGKISRKLSKRKPARNNKLSKLERELTALKKQLRETPGDSPLAINRFSSTKRELSKQDLQRMTKQEKFLHNLYN